MSDACGGCQADSDLPKSFWRSLTGRAIIGLAKTVAPQVALG